jgi:hypothetical protein
MKILALEKEVPDTSGKDFSPHLKAEAKKVWELHQKDVIREIYFRRDWPGAVLVLECASVDAAQQALNELPLVKERLIAFDLIPLGPYPGFGRLFAG